jgi:hypothetical protein
MANGEITKEAGQDLLEKYTSDKLTRFPQPSIHQMSRWKTAASNDVSDAARGGFQTGLTDFTGDKLAEAGGLQREIENSANKALPGQGDKIAATNKELGNILSVQGVAEKARARDAVANLNIPPNFAHHMGTSISAGGAQGGVWQAGTKALSALWNATPIRTGLGYGINKNGPLLNSALRTMYDNSQDPSRNNPWKLTGENQ